MMKTWDLKTDHATQVADLTNNLLSVALGDWYITPLPRAWWWAIRLCMKQWQIHESKWLRHALSKFLLHYGRDFCELEIYCVLDEALHIIDANEI